MPTVTIQEHGCRGCTMCADICPADVFEVDKENFMATVQRQDDCIGCLSCAYICPSNCIEVADATPQRPFYRIEENVQFVEKFVQAKAATTSLTDADWDEAYKDVSATLVSLSKAIMEMMGRGAKAVGRRAGTVGASHLPEMYEESDLDGVFRALQRRFRSALDFEYTVDGDEVTLDLKPCGLCGMVEESGDKVGDSIMCQLFHEYMAGLTSSYTSANYRCTAPVVGKACQLKLSRH
jgi:ferredoxin